MAIFSNQATLTYNGNATTYTQDPVTGAYSIFPGIATLVVTGTI